MFCPSCGKESSNDFDYCPKCGENLRIIKSRIAASVIQGAGLEHQQGPHTIPCLNQQDGSTSCENSPFTATKQNQAIVGIQAGYWRRYFARMLDIYLIALVSLPIISLILCRYSASFINLATNPNKQDVLNIMMLPVVLFLEAIIFGFFGNTPGKALLGLKVIKANDEPLGFMQYLKRNLTIWWNGLAFGIPLLSILAMISQANLVRKCQLTSYDSTHSCKVIMQSVSFIKTAIFLIFFLVVLSVFSSFHYFNLQLIKEFGLIKTQNHYSWVNPSTQKSVQIHPQWKLITEQEDANLPVYVFTESIMSKARVEFGFEESKNIGMEDYSKLFLFANLGKMNFADRGKHYIENGQSVWAATGENHEGNRVTVKVMLIRNLFWRMIAVQAIPYDYTDELVKSLTDSLWSSVL